MAQRVQKLKYLRIKEENGNIYGDIPLAIDALNVTMQNKNDLQSTIGDIDYVTQDDITTNLRRIKDKIENIDNDITLIEETKADADEVNNQINNLTAFVESLDLDINNLGLYHDYNTGLLYLTYKGVRGTQGIPMPSLSTQISQSIEAYVDKVIKELDIQSQITIDKELSENSTNPVENKAIYEAIQDVIHDLSLNRPEVFFNTTQGWNSQSGLVGQSNTIYVYTDYKEDEQGRKIAGVKIGDGNAYLIDAPFITQGISTIEVDSELSSISRNPLENRAVHAALSNLAQSLSLNRPEIFFNTVQGWNLQSTLVGKKNSIYVYTNYQQDQDGHNIAGIKVGDGNAYLIDAPFLDTLYLEHINDNSIHITDEQREFWNNKVSCYYSLTQDETVVFTTS